MSGQRPPPTDGLVPRRVYPARPVLGTCARLGSRWARLPHASLAGNCALCVCFLCKSCFIRDIDLHPPMAWFPGAYALRALSWAHVRVWGATGRGYHTPASQGIAHFAHSSYVNRALVGISTFGFRMERSARAEFGESACTGVACPVDAGAQGLRARFACASRAANDEVRCAHL